jgi:HEAT repeat protein
MQRRKPRLFAFPREVDLAGIDQWATDPEQMRLLTDVIDAFGTVAKTRKLLEHHLRPIERAARYPDDQVRGVAMTRLSVLTHYFDEAIIRFEGLLRDEDSSVRRFAVFTLANTPPRVIYSMLPGALADPDWQVRKAAATIAGALPLPDLGGLFADRLADEQDARVKVVLQMAVRHQTRLAAL